MSEAKKNADAKKETKVKETNMSEAKKNADAKKETKVKETKVKETKVFKDFAEVLTVTRTLFKNNVSKTSIVECSLAKACFDNTQANKLNITCTQLAYNIVIDNKVIDCFHKRESNKSNDILSSTILRIRHHIKDTLKTHHLASELYSYTTATDSVQFTDKYHAFCKTDKMYMRNINAVLARIKYEYAQLDKDLKKTKTEVLKKIKTDKRVA